MTSTELIIPAYSRSSDIRDLALGKGCEGKLFLSYLYPGELPDAVWFILGTAAHTAYEFGCHPDNENIELDDLLNVAFTEKMMLVAEAGGLDNVIESAAKNPKRSKATLDQDLEFVVTQWFNQVHPNGNERTRWFEQELVWPPREVEHRIELTPRTKSQRLFTTIDAIFDRVDPKFGSEVIIVDWKTGSKPKSDDEQLQVYHYGGRKEGWVSDEYQANVVGFFWHATGKDQWVYDYPGDEIIDEWIDRTYMRKQRAIERAPAFTPDWWCNYCIAKDKCPLKGDGDLQEIRDLISQATIIDRPQEDA